MVITSPLKYKAAELSEPIKKTYKLNTDWSVRHIVKVNLVSSEVSKASKDNTINQVW